MGVVHIIRGCIAKRPVIALPVAVVHELANRRDRLTHRVHIREANGPSCRLREANRGLRKQTSSRRKKD